MLFFSWCLTGSLADRRLITIWITVWKWEISLCRGEGLEAQSIFICQGWHTVRLTLRFPHSIWDQAKLCSSSLWAGWFTDRNHDSLLRRCHFLDRLWSAMASRYNFLCHLFLGNSSVILLICIFYNWDLTFCCCGHKSLSVMLRFI